MRLFGIFVRAFALLATLSLAQAQAPAPRAALVIGNADYSFGPLRNPKNDAEAMAKALEEAGFDVTVATDADQTAMENAVHDFGAKLKSRGGVGLFYFSGHGAQIDGENYLIPVSLTSAEQIKTGSVSATEIVNAMAGAHNGLNIFILDACRTNPFDPNGAHGLSRIDSNASLFVSYATSPGAVALDGAGHNSPYTKYLSEWIATPNLSIEDTFKRTLKGVYVDTHGQQTPWISSTFFGDFVFHPEGAEADQEDDQAGEGEDDEAEAPTLTGVYRANGTNPSGSNYTGIVALKEDGEDFKLTWWIGKDVFNGSGHYAGKMLVINWGEKNPVIYSFGNQGALDGEWADGSASETLTPIGTAASADDDVSAPEGEYRVEGKDADGKPYDGTVDIEKSGDAYHLTWKVGDSEYEGEGTFAENLLTVNWGSTTPIVYALADDGSLTGLWDSGHGEETLTPEQ
ncbi:MAG: caspase family protein [Methyloceanibacter sp.]